MRLALIAVIALVAAVELTACSWVDLTPEGRGVEVLKTEQAAGCRQVGTTNVMVVDRIAGLPRSYGKMHDELERLARNSAPDLGGNAVVPISDIREGRQRYAVFDCPRGGD